MEAYISGEYCISDVYLEIVIIDKTVATKVTFQSCRILSV